MTVPIFGKQHFEAIRITGGRSGRIDHEQYETLKEGYTLTETWAKKVQEKLFPEGHVLCIKAPMNQAQIFKEFTWARIFIGRKGQERDPLAYTVGIDPRFGFITKIDTSNTDSLKGEHKTAFEALRGEIREGGQFVDVLKEDMGLKMPLEELAEWSVRVIQHMPLNIEEFARKIGIHLEGKAQPMTIDSIEAVLKRFDRVPLFTATRLRWSEETRSRFLRIALAAHEAGFDWWLINKGDQVRFGRKEKAKKAASFVTGVVYCRQSLNLALEVRRPFGDLEKTNNTQLNEDIVSRFIAGMRSKSPSSASEDPKPSGRSGYWPDELTVSPNDEEGEGIERVTYSASGGAVNKIFYGPPGTGKTWKIRELMKEYTDGIDGEVSQTTQNEVLIREILPKLRWWEKLAYALFELGGKAKVGQIAGHPIIEPVIRHYQSKRQRIWSSLQSRTILESKTVRYTRRLSPSLFDKTENSEWFLVDGWQNTTPALAELYALRTDDIVVDESEDEGAKAAPAEGTRRFSFVTFHQSYGYEDFIEGLRPVIPEDKLEAASDTDVEYSSQDVKYVIKKGVFLSLCEKARERPDERFAMFIDEINRGNVSKIFGELITLIECDKRDNSDRDEAAILGQPQLPPVRLAVSQDPFLVPVNVDIYGTMNTADRSLALIDTALRRRFDFVALYPDTNEKTSPLAGLTVRFDGTVIDVRKMLEVINRRIELLYDRDHTIGHAYFMGLIGVDDGAPRFERMRSIFRDRIIPLLEDYFFADWGKIRLTLGDNQKKSGDFQFIRVIESIDENMRSLFGELEDAEIVSEKPRYLINEDAFHSARAFAGIYEK